MKNREMRTFQTTEIRVVRNEGEAPKIVGHAVPFNNPTHIGQGPFSFIERVRPGAFTQTINEDDIRGLFNHDPNIVLGRNKSGTMRLWEDEDGLGYEIKPPENEWAKAVLESIDRRDVTGSSFGFEATDEDWTLNDDGPDEREIITAKLWDVSPVTFPAYEDTDVATRRHQEFRTSIGQPLVDDRAAKIGEGQGVGKPKQGEGGRDMCYCPECDKEIKHERGTPCTEQVCPECGSKLEPVESNSQEIKQRQADAEDWQAIPYSRHDSEPTQDEETPWDGPQVRADADVDQLKNISLFEDKEHLDVKSGFKGHHHQTDGVVNWNGVRSAMGVLRGARGGFTGIEDAELSKGYDHLVDHYKQFEKEAPENPFRSERSNSDKMKMELRLRS